MTESAATLLVTVLSVYAALGLLFAVAFVLVGAGRIDPVARAGSVGFKLLIVPGAAALWPLLALRWMRSAGAPPEQTTPHTIAADRGGC